jgi:hypothetical protein
MDKQASWLELDRCAEGILVHVKVATELEEFFKSLGTGELHPPSAYTPAGSYGNNNAIGTWVSKDGKSLEVYQAAPENLEIISNGQKIRLDIPNQPLEVDVTLGYVSNVNISFLRLKGISSESGVRFLVRGGVISKAGIYDIRDKIIRAIKYIYSEFVTPTKAQGIIYETLIKEE